MNATKTTTPAWKRTAIAATAFLALAAATPLHAFTLEGTFNGTTRYVSKTGSNANGGTSWDDAKLTIQAAVNLCADGDTVIVDDGEYSDTTAWSTTSSGTTYNNPCVVQITKRIHLVSRNGKFRTHIVGQRASTSSGVANDGTAHRCIFINNVSGVLIEGFTIRDGATAGSGSGNNTFDSAGGICDSTISTSYLVDSDIVNCRAGMGAALSRGVVPIRCTFVGNRAANSPHVFYRGSYAYNCVFAMNGSSSGACLQNVQGSRLVNCTFIDNNCGAVYANGGSMQTLPTHNLYNCAFLGSGEIACATTANNTKGVFLTNCVQTATTGRMTESGNANCTTGVPELQHYYAADSGEWKFVTNGDLKDAGTDDARAIAATFVPEEYLDTDFFGNPRKVGDRIDIGAIEAQGEAADPASGSIRLGSNVAVRDGEAVMFLPRGFVSVGSGMAQARLVPTLGPATPFFGFAVSGDWTDHYRYPDLGEDCGAWMTPPASGETVSVTATAATDEKWVDGSYVGGDSDGSEAKPFTTIQAGADAVATLGIVHVAPGTYATGGTTLSGQNIPARVGIDKSMALRSTGGAAATVIKGDASTRCVSVRSQSYDTHVQGFTIRDGTADYGSGLVDRCGGGFYTTAANNVAQTWANATGLSFTNHASQVTDCVFLNNTARHGAAMCGGWAQRCVFSGNKIGETCATRGAVAYCTFLSACLVTNNLQTHTDSICSLYWCAPYNVTFAESKYTAGVTSGNANYRPTDRNTPAFNCAFYGGYLDAHNSDVKVVPVGNVGDTSLEAKSWLARYDANLLFIDAAGGDFHLRTATDASTKGDAAADRTAMFAVGDFEGNALAYVNGNPVPGAYSTVVGGRDLYVDAENGSDANDGRTAATAKKTLAAALALSVPGDTVHAAAGDYDEGTQTHSGTVLIAPQNGTQSPSRGVVPAGVTLVGDEGPEVTFITGATDDANGNGMGNAAVRCLTALAGATVRGFTLKDGATFHTTGAMRDENTGGLVLAPSCRHGETGTAVFENCVFSNGYARTAADVAGGVLRRCRLYGGQATSGAAISMYSRFEHCLLVNTADGDTGVRYCGGMRSCTYVNTRGAGSGDNSEFHGSLTDFTPCYENSILATANRTGGNAVTMKNMTNCLWVTGGGNATIDSATCANVTTVATVADALSMLDADYRPLAGSSLVDAGDRSLLAKLADGGETDLGGGQRIYGGQVDIGAYEYDLRPAIADALGGRVSAVGAASTDSTLADGAVVLPEGEISATVSANDATSLVVPVQVTGAGTLSIFLGDSETPAATVTAADGAQQLRLSFAAGDTTVRLVFDGAGSASIGRFAGADPFVLTIR